jgi:hypothetical protein
LQFVNSKIFYITLMMVLVSCGGEVTRKEQYRHRSSDLSVVVDANAMEKNISEIVGGTCENPAVLKYKSKSISVPAKSWWVSSELFLRKGQTAKISASGNWTIWADKTPTTTADGYEEFDRYKGCNKGALVARVGLYKDNTHHCVGENGIVQAETDGIVYLGMNDNASPKYHGGSLEVDISSSEGESAPTIPYLETANTNYCAISSGWVELESANHIILTVPAALADKNASTIGASLQFLDENYKAQKKLAGGFVPYEGERIRFYPDYSLTDNFWIVVQNPVRFDPRALNGVKPSESFLLDLVNENSNSWDFIQSLGVMFSQVNGAEYQVGPVAMESWAGIFAFHSLGELGKNDTPENVCFTRDNHLSSGSYVDIQRSSYLQMCLMLTTVDLFGWSIFESYFSSLALLSDDERAVLQSIGEAEMWDWIADRMDQSSGLKPADSIFTELPESLFPEVFPNEPSAASDVFRDFKIIN